MDSILDALQEGRLLELPDNDKRRSLQLLAHLIEAIPSLPAGTDVAGLIWAREQIANTNLGLAWACPHARIPVEGDLVCAIGWSPKGIDYGPPGEPPVEMVVMYLVPENQKNHYLKEVSMLVKVLRSDSRFQDLDQAPDLTTARNRLLDLVGAAKDFAVPDARARMIQLETRVAVPAAPAFALAGMQIEPVTVVAGPGMQPVILTQNRELLALLAAQAGLGEGLTQQASLENGPWRLLKRAATHYQGELIVYDCLALRPS